MITTDLLKVIDKLYFHFELLLKSEKKNRNNVCIIYPFGAGMSYPSGAHEVFKGVRVYLDFCVVFCQSLFVFVLFLLVIVMNVRQFSIYRFRLPLWYLQFFSLCNDYLISFTC